MRISDWSSDVCSSDLVSWLIFAGLLVMAAVVNLALADPQADIAWVVAAAILVGVAGATFDIVIDAYRIEILEPRQLGVGSGMRSEERRVGKECVGKVRFRWWRCN